MLCNTLQTEVAYAGHFVAIYHGQVRQMCLGAQVLVLGHIL